jgi:hypothetical protein
MRQNSTQTEADILCCNIAAQYERKTSDFPAFRMELYFRITTVNKHHYLHTIIDKVADPHCTNKHGYVIGLALNSAASFAPSVVINFMI